MIWTCLIYFCIGLARDAAAALYYRSISERRAGRAGGVGGFITAFDLSVYGLLIRSWSPELVVAYAAGTGLGTYIIVKMSKENRT